MQQGAAFAHRPGAGTGGIAPVTLPESGEYTLVVDPRDRTTGEATLQLLVPS